MAGGPTIDPDLETLYRGVEWISLREHHSHIGTRFLQPDLEGPLIGSRIEAGRQANGPLDRVGMEILAIACHAADAFGGILTVAGTALALIPSSRGLGLSLSMPMYL